ncbi:unnamed protein product [Closterium sp. Naga37s-1]|nr:unnamed protein product [Closterium sp. Naga37s-1]
MGHIRVRFGRGQASTLLSSVDSLGRTIVSTFSSSSVTPDSVCHLAPSPCGITESGPCCTAVSVTEPSTIRELPLPSFLPPPLLSPHQVATSRFFPHSLDPVPRFFPCSVNLHDPASPSPTSQRSCASLHVLFLPLPPLPSPPSPTRWPLPASSPDQWTCTTPPPPPVATSRFFPRSVDLHDPASPSPASPLRTFRLPFPPAAVGFLGGTERDRGGGKRRGGEMEGEEEGNAVEGVRLLAVCEGPQLSIWDERAAENGGCIQRITVSPAAEPLYALASTVGSGTGSVTGLVAVGGAERTVAVYDVRKWAARGRWVSCVRQDVMGIPVAGGEREDARQEGQDGLSFGSDESVFVWSGDNEVVCGRWTEGEGRVGGVRRAEKGRGKGGSGRGGEGGGMGRD